MQIYNYLFHPEAEIHFDGKTEPWTWNCGRRDRNSGWLLSPQEVQSGKHVADVSLPTGNEMIFSSEIIHELEMLREGK